MLSSDNPQIDLAYKYLSSTKKNVFLTGKAGTGKTTFLRNLRNESPKRMVVIAPTGVAAINAGGVTIHSFFQLPFGPWTPTRQDNTNGFIPGSNERSFKFGQEKLSIIRSLDLLVIDEISMVRADLLDAIDQALRQIRHSDAPFGNVQLLLIGDLQQLPPVVKRDEWDLLRPYYNSPFFFDSMALQQTDYVCIELQHIYRQSDEVFINILNKIRDNNLDEEALDHLSTRYIRGFEPDDDDGYITLTTHNEKANTLNWKKLNQIKLEPQVFTAKVEGEFPEYAYPADFELTLKVGAQVMFIKNDISFEKRYFNGKIGVIISIDEDIIEVQCPNDEVPIKVDRQKWQNFKYSINQETKEIYEEEIGLFTQFPLRLAWAITIHKSQGLTFDNVIIDAQDAFSHGQVYVALSRCRTLEGIVLSSPVNRGSLVTEYHISQYNSKIPSLSPTLNSFVQAKKQYQIHLLQDLFDFKEVAKLLYPCIKISRENANILAGNLNLTFSQMLKSINDQFTPVCDKFVVQLHQLSADTEDLETSETIQDRIKKGCQYFKDNLDQQIWEHCKNIQIETDNKAVRNSLKSSFEKLCQKVLQKRELLELTANNFSVSKYLHNKARIMLDSEFGGKKASVDSGNSFIKHGKLFGRLKKWRTEKAEESGRNETSILKTKILVDIANKLPLSAQDLKDIDGFTINKIAAFGGDILDMVYAFAKEQDISIKTTSDSFDKQLQSIKKPDSKKLTLEMFQSGKSIEDIAKERSMAMTTIEGHLAHFVGNGTLKIEALVEQPVLNLIITYFKHARRRELTPAKEKLGNAVSYGQLRMVLKHLEYTSDDIFEEDYEPPF